MVKIRYAELPVGLHVATEARGRGTIVYLLPGLTPAQRKDALTVARRSARLGHGPPLPRAEMAVGLAADRVRTTACAAVNAVRQHPMLLLPVVVLVSFAIVAATLSVMTVLGGVHGRSSGSASLLPAAGSDVRPGGAVGGQAAEPSPSASGGPALRESPAAGPAPGGQGTPSPAAQSMPQVAPGTGGASPARSTPPRQARPAHQPCPKLQPSAFCVRS